MSGERQPRLIVSTEGMEGSGKTWLALSAPGPTAYLDFDYGVEGLGGKNIATHHYYDLLAAQWMPDAQAKRHAQEVMRKFVADFRAAIGVMRTIVVDTFSAAWAGQRFARSEDKYVDMEQEFVGLVRAAYANPSTNVILIHHMRQDWARSKDGKSYKAPTWSRDGMDGVPAMVQLAIRQRFVQPQLAGTMVTVPGRFEIDVLKCRDNFALAGTTLPAVDFATLGAMVAPSIDWSK